MRWTHRLRSELSRPVDAASVAVFRIVFGAVMLVEVCRYWFKGWIRDHYAVPEFLFPYPFFDWVPPLPDPLLPLHFGLLALAAAGIVLGIRTRISAAVFAIGFWWWFLLDQTHYLNHFYLIGLIALLLAVVPAGRAWSFDATFRPHPGGATVPAWAVWLLRFQIGVPYVFGGVAKLNPDWLAGEPIRMWLGNSRGLPLAGAWCAEEWFVLVVTWGGLLLDLLIVPALLWRRTRAPAYAVSILFHATNALVFSIGVFPWLMMAATTVFFEPDWPRRLPFLRRFPPSQIPSSSAFRASGAALLAAWVVFHCLFPMRHLLYPGDVSWTEEGHRFAWHMKLRGKSGTGTITVREPAGGSSWRIDPRDHLTPKQIRKVFEHPDMLLVFAHHLSSEHERRGLGPLEVRAQVLVSLNGRRFQPFIDPEVNLAAEPRTLLPSPWILPLTEPLPSR